jgi:hypothetical protein
MVYLGSKGHGAKVTATPPLLHYKAAGCGAAASAYLHGVEPNGQAREV